MVNPWANGRKGIDILADILKHTDAMTTRNLLKNLQNVEPGIAAELRKRIVSFEDLAYGDPRGLQRLVKIINIRDLAMALKGSQDGVLEAIAHQMSPRAIEDLRDSIAILGPARVSDVDAARFRIMEVVRQLLERHELYFSRDSDPYVR